MNPRSPRVIPSLPWMAPLLFLIAGLSVVASMDRVLGRVLCDFQVNQSEAANAEVARLLGRGILPYPDPSATLSMFSLYPPLFSLLAGLPMRLVSSPFLPGRLIALAAFLGCAGLLFRWGAARWGNTPAALAASLLLLSPTWRAWGSMVRPDTLALFLSFLAWVLLLGPAGRRDDAWRILGAGALAGAALLAKQTLVTLPLAFTIHSLVRREGRRWVLFAGGAALIVLPATVALEAATDGAYLDLILRGAAHGFDAGLLGRALSAWFIPEAGWLFAALTWGLASRRVSGLIAWQAGLSLLWLTGLGRPGAAENYMMEFELFGILFLGEALFRPARPVAAGKSRLRVAILFFLAGLASFLVRPGPAIPSAQERAVKREALSFYAGEGDHLAVDADLPLMAGKPLFLPPAEYTLMAEKGLLSTEPLKRAVRARAFRTIEVYATPRQYLIPEEVVAEIRRHYHVDRELQGRLWLVPKEGTHGDCPNP